MSNGAAAVLDLQKMAGNQAVSALIARTPTDTKEAGAQITVEDVKSIVDAQLATWYVNTRLGVLGAHLAHDTDEWVGWFLIALGGNLLWAATAFANPAAAIMIRTMSVAGAAIGSGTAEKLAHYSVSEGSKPDEFKDLVVTKLSEQYTAMQGSDALTTTVMAELKRLGLTDANNSAQAQLRREAAWRVMFKETIPFQNPSAIEKLSKKNVEAIWAKFSPIIDDFQQPSRDRYVSVDYPYRSAKSYVETAYYTALVRSGVVNQLAGVKVSYTNHRTPDHWIDAEDMAYTDDLYATYALPDGAVVDVDLPENTRGALPAKTPVRDEYGNRGAWSPFLQSYQRLESLRGKFR